MRQADHSLSTPARTRVLRFRPHRLSDEMIRAESINGALANIELEDPVEPGLVLRIADQQARWCFVGAATASARSRMTLGFWPELTTHSARVKVRKLRRQMRVPIDPEKATLGHVLASYDNLHLSQLRTGKEAYRVLLAALHRFLDDSPGTITRRDLAEIVDRLAATRPFQANRLLSFLKAFFNWAVTRGYLDESPARAIVKPTKPVVRERTPSKAELVRIWAATNHLGYPFGPAVQVLLLTALRRSEVGGMRLSELELDSDGHPVVWTLPAERSKNGRGLRVPLSSLTARILSRAIMARPHQSDFIFSTVPGRPIVNWFLAKNRIDRLVELGPPAGNPLPYWRYHDLRRSFATIACDELDIDFAVADRCLNHAIGGEKSFVARVYNRSELFEQRRAALQSWSDYIETAVRKAGELAQ